MEKIDVVFRKFKEGDVIALLPELDANYGTIMSYQHIGQHGEALWDIAGFTKLATPEEYADLLQELRRIYTDNPPGGETPVELVVKKRVNYGKVRAMWERHRQRRLK